MELDLAGLGVLSTVDLLQVVDPFPGIELVQKAHSLTQDLFVIVVRWISTTCGGKVAAMT